jgi:magnesium transporter
MATKTASPFTPNGRPAAPNWINVAHPTPAEAADLMQELDIPAEYIAHSLDVDERARLEKDGHSLLIILRIPYVQDHLADVPYVTIPLGIVVQGEKIITICREENDVIQAVRDGRLPPSTGGHRFVLHLFLLTAEAYLACLQQINQKVDELEDRLQRSMRNRELGELLKYQKSLVYFTNALKANEMMMERLQRHQLLNVDNGDELWEDVLIESQQAAEMTTIASNILGQMMDAFASIISNNLNVVMEFLAAITIILALPTLLASLYGMNVNLPFQHSEVAFWLILLLSFGLSGIIALVFVKRNWL